MPGEQPAPWHSHVLLGNYHFKASTQLITSVCSPPCFPSLALILMSTNCCFLSSPPLMRPAHSAPFSCHVFIVVTILKMPSACCRRRAFSTCASHLTAVSIFHGTAPQPPGTQSKWHLCFTRWSPPCWIPWSTVWEIRMSRTRISKIMDSKMFSYFLSKLFEIRICLVIFALHKM